MKIVSIGGGPAGLYFALLMKRADPSNEVRVLERNRSGETFGFGVVFSDATLGNLAEADPATYEAISSRFKHWDDIDIFIRGERIRSTGHGFCGLGRQELLTILENQCRDLGVELSFETEVASLADVGEADLILAADGVSSKIRDELAEHFEPEVDFRPNKFVWLGTTVPYDAFTFYFKENDAGLWRVHAYRYKENGSTFIVETTHDAWLRSGMDKADEQATVDYLEKLFADELGGHRLINNRSIWRSFPNIRNRHWHHGNVVLVGDAVHTAHFSIGSGTKLAMEDSISLRNALLQEGSVEKALQAYEATRRPEVESLQRAAQVSLEWFENTERYLGLPPKQFAFSLLSRSLRVTHDNLKVRDPGFVEDFDRWFANTTGLDTEQAVAPLFTPLQIGGRVVHNRVVSSPTRLDAAPDGVVGDDYLVHAGARAMGGAGIVIAGCAAVSEGGRLTPRAPGLYTSPQVDGWSRVVDYITSRSFALAGVRLGHSGARGAIEHPWPGDDRPLAEPWELVAASALAYADNRPTPRMATKADIDIITADYVRACKLADDAGFDVVELDFAEGGFVASFISPLTNRRGDDYGGSRDGRYRLATELVAAVREVLPAHKLLFVRLCADDGQRGGTVAADAAELAKRVCELGANAITVCAGNTLGALPAPEERAFSVKLADEVRYGAGVPVVAEGGLWSADDACSAVAAGRADLCSMERALLYDPNLPRRAASAYGVEMPWPQRYYRARGFRPRS